MRHWRLTGRILCLALGFEPATRADENTTLPPVTVPLPPAEAPPESPTRRDPSGAITVIETREYQGEAKETAELLAPSPGVVLLDQGGFGQLKLLNIRGASANGVLVFLDGIPLNGAGGSLDLSLVPSAIVERFEVLRGGAGAKYGSGGLGGAINILTHRTRRGAEISAEATQGSFGTWIAKLGASGGIGLGEGLLLVHAAHSRGDYSYPFNDRPQLPGNPSVQRTRENNDATLGGALLKYHYPLPHRWSLDAMGELSLESRGLAGTVENPTVEARQSNQRVSSTVRVNHSFGDGAELSNRLYFRRDHLSFQGGYFGLLDQVDSAMGAEVGVSTSLGGWQQLSVQGQVEYESLRQESSSNPSWFRIGSLVFDELLLFAGALSLIPSVRLDRTGPFTGLSPKLGVLLTLPAGFDLRGNIGRAFRAPSFIELYVAAGTLLPNPALRPERSNSADLAIGHRTAISFISAGAFYSSYENLISYEYYPPLLAKAYNFNSAQVYGLEAEGELKPFSLVSALLGYTLLFSQNLRDDPRYYLKELPYRPRHKIYARLAGGPAIARLRSELNFQSQQFFNRTETLTVPARAMLNVGVSSTLMSSPQITASFEVKNLLDVQTQDLDGYPLPGRAAYLTLRVAYDRPSNKNANPRHGGADETH